MSDSLLPMGGNALASCVTSLGTRLQAAAGSVWDAPRGNYDRSGVLNNGRTVIRN